jgi:hypothetical protein
MKTSLVVVVEHDESFRNFFPCRGRPDRSGFFQAPGGYWVESGTAFREFRHWIPG